MKKRPLLLKFIIGVYLLAPVLSVLQLYYLSYESLIPRIPDENFFERFDAIRITILALYPLVAVFLYHVRKFSWYVYTSHSAFLVALNAYEMATRQSFPFGILLFILLAGFGTVVFYYRNNLKELFYNPRLRWWEVAERYACFCPVQLWVGDQKGSGYITDVSMSGCFFYSSLELKEDTPFRFEIDPNSKEKFGDLIGEAKVMRYYFEAGVSMMGYGARFVKPSRALKSSLRRLISFLRGQGLGDRAKEKVEVIRNRIEMFERKRKKAPIRGQLEVS